jgi:ribose transport system substrate-binding protein
VQKIRVISLILIIALVSSFMLIGCSTAKPVETTQSQETTGATPTETEVSETPAFDPAMYPLGIVTLLKSNPVVQIMTAGFTTRAAELGYSAEIFAGDTVDSQEMIKFGEQAMAKGVKGLYIYLLDPSVYPLIKKAADAGIPVVAAHTPIEKPEDVPGLKAWAACEPKLYGATAAQAIAEKIGKKGIVAITQGSFNNTENSAAQAFADEMKNYPDIKVLDPIEEGFDPAQATAKAVSIIQGNPGLSAAFSTTGSGPATWAKGAEQAGIDNLVIIGMDYIRQNLDLIKEGKVYGVVAQPLFEEHQKTVELLDQLLRGEEVEFANIIDAPLVTLENLDEYYKLLDDVDKAFGR